MVKSSSKLQMIEKLLLILSLIVSYVVLSFYTDGGKTFPFIVDFYFQILRTFINNIFYIFVYIPVHTFNQLILSIPSLYITFLQRYKIDFSGPFSRLFPNIYKFLISHFPLFNLPAKYKIKFQLAFLMMNFKYKYVIMKYFLVGILAFLVLFLLRNTIAKLFNSKLLRIWFSLFFVLLILHKWVSAKGPFHDKIREKMQQIENYHSNLFYKFIGLFTNENIEEKTTEEKVPGFIEKVKNKFSNLSQIQMKEFFGLLANKSKSFIKSISNIKPKELYNKTSSFYENLKNNKNNGFYLKMKTIRPQPFDKLFIYFIYSFFWSLIVKMILSIFDYILKKFSQKNDDVTQRKVYNFADFQQNQDDDDEVVKEEKRKYVDSNGSTHKITKRIIGDKWHEIDEIQDKRGKIEVHQSWHNVSDDEIADFNKKWQMKSKMKKD